MNKRRSLVAANWKMNGQKANIQTLLDTLLPSIKDCACDVAICPPSLFLGQVQDSISSNSSSNIHLGVQNFYPANSGAFTGEISASMLEDFNCKFVLVGHSERREIFSESDEFVAQKFASAQEHNLTPVLCVGESQQQRESGETDAVILKQLQAVIQNSGIQSFSNAVIAYEPIWAIGTGLTASPEQAQAVHRLLRSALAELSEEIAQTTRILYGGSVKASNASELFAQEDIDGALVGGASLIAEEFKAICDAATDNINQ